MTMNPISSRKFGLFAAAALLVAALRAMSAGAPQSPVRPVVDDGAWREARGAASRGAGRIHVRTLSRNGGTQRLVYRFPGVEVVKLDDGTVDVRMPSAESSTRPGEPVLPFLSARVAVPQGHEVVRVDVRPGAFREHRLDAPVRHASEPYPLSRPQERRDTPPKAAVYNKDDAYPASPAAEHSVQTKRGIAFVDLVLHPVAYHPKSGRLVAYEELVVEVQTRPAAAKGGAWRARFRARNDADVAAPLIDNPALLDEYKVEPLASSAPSPVVPRAVVAPAATADGGPVPFNVAPPVLPCDGAEAFQHVIITSASLAGSVRPFSFERIVELRQEQGLTSTIVTIEAILAAYPAADAATAVRDFIRDAYTVWGTEFVLLGGDSGIVPIRKLHAEVGGSYVDEIPSDLYFQCLDGSFNSDGDGIWGEPTDGADRMDGRPGSDIDLYAEIAVGRVPVATDIELANWVQKQVLFEQDRRLASAPYLRGALMVGEHLGFGGISEYATASMEEIRLGSEAHGYRTEGFLSLNIHTNVATLYDAPGYSWTTSELANLVNTEQFSLLNHLGHCNTDHCMKFTGAGVLSQWKNQKPAFLYTQGCYPGAFDDECIGETLLGGTTSGLFGGVFNARYGWGAYNTTDGASQRFNRWFWHAMFGDMVSELGLLNQQAHERNAARINEEAMRWCFYESNLFGDPAQMLYGFAPEVHLDRDAYRSDAQAEVTVVWPAAPAAIMDVQATLTLTNELGVIGETNLVCSRVGEYGAAIGRFVSAPVDLAALGAVHGTFLVATWVYPPDVAEIFEDTALIDNVPPMISNLRAVDRDGTSLTVAWDTDELATGVARAGVQLPPPVGWAAAVQDTPAINHQVRLVGLEPLTRYSLAVWAEDLAGNRATSPADPSSTVGADYVTASTVGFETIGRFDFERSAEGWAASNINAAACWEYGQPQDYGPVDATRCWGTVLDGRYPDGANATLTSPAFTVRSTPVIRFRHWLDAQYSMDFAGVTPTPVPYGDYGLIEVFLDGVWRNVTPYADVAAGANWITGNSGGWQQVVLALPPEFAHRALALRFRFVSDEQRFLDGNPAGWYVDDVLVQDVPDTNVGISNCDVLDSGVGLTGDGDGFAEPGETVSLRPRLFNFGDQPVLGLSGSFVVLVAGNPSSDAVLVDGSPAPVVYGTVNPWEEVPAQSATRLALSPALLPGTVVTLLQTLTDSTGRMIESRYDLLIGSYVTISGSVVDVVGDAPIPNSAVVAVRGDERLQATTGPGGAFVLTGAISNGQYSVTASAAGYSPATVVVTAPTNGVTIKLGTSVGFVSPSNLVFQAKVGASDSAMLTVSNAVQATVAMQVTPRDVVYAGANTGWLSLPTAPFTLAPGQSLQLAVTASARGLPVGHYFATIVLDWSDPLQPRVEVPVEFDVLQDPSLAYGGFQIRNDTDADGYLEESETGDMFVYLLNTNGMSAAFGVTGVLTPLDPRVTLTGAADLLWTYIPASSSALSDNGVGLALDPGIADGEALPFQLDVTYAGGPTTTLFFSLVHGRYHTVIGVVELLATPANVPVTNAVVVATATNGTQYFSLPAAADGSYSIPSVPAGNTWFRVIPPAGYPFVAPEGRNEVVATDPTVVDFLLNDYGTNSAHLVFHDVSIDDGVYGDGDGAIDPGERLVVRVRVYNDGMAFAAGLNGLLDLADMGAGVGPFMSILQAAANAVPDTIGPSNIPLNIYNYATMAFEVEVNPAAVGGDLQRFTLLVSDATLPTAREWPFDFALTVGPLYSVRGTVTFANPADNTPANLALVRVVATVDGLASSQIPGADGSYAFVAIPEGAEVTVSVTPPIGFVADTQYAFATLLTDQVGLDFILSESEFTVTPTQLDETIWEGQSATNTLTLHNGSPDPIAVDLSVAYKRGPYDVVAPDDTLAALLTANAVDWATLDEALYVSGELEIRFRDGTGWMERQEILKQHGLRALFHFRLLPACVAVPVAANALGDGGVAPLAAALSADERILYVQPSAKVEPFAVPNDPMFPEQYNLLNERQTGGTQGADINVLPAWDEVTTGSRDIVVAVCDTGVEWTHDDLLANVWSNPLDGPGDVNGDGTPGVRDIDDDGDVDRSLFFFNVLTGVRQGPEVVDPRFDPEMWRDDTTLAPKPGVPAAYEVRAGSNDLPDFFEPYLRGVLSMASLLADSRFVDANGNGTPDLFEDLNRNGTIDLFDDEDGDGVVNETGIDFRDQDVMTSDYNGNGLPLITQKFVMLPWIGGRYFRVLVEQWDVSTGPDGTLVSDYQLAQADDDENGYGNDIHGWNFYSWSNDVLEGDLRYNHGTHVAGTIGAVGNNGLGISGVSQQVSLMPLALTSRAKRVSFTTYGRIAKAIEYALEQDVRVSNHSWGGSSGAGVMYEVMKLAERDFNHLFVVAAGNSGLDVDNARVYPAYFSTVLNNVITVAATDHDDRLATFTCWGKDSVQIAAPGVDILSTVTESRNPSLDGSATLAGTYALMSGTSMAAPHVSGAAALLWAHAPEASYEAVKNALLVGSRFDPDLQGWVKSAGHLDVGRAVRSLGRDWLALSTNLATVASGGSTAVQVVFNPERNVPAGFYEAEILASSEIGERIVPVTLTVNEQPIARFESLRIVADTDSDGYAEPSETVDFRISLHNVGSTVFLNLQGVLTPVTPGVGVTVGTAAWDVLYDGETGESLTSYRVTIPAGAPAQVEFDLTLTADGAHAQTLRIVLSTVRRYTVSGFVRNTLSVGVPSAIVECWGAGVGRAITAADGSFKVHGLTNGVHKLRAIPSGYTRSATQLATIADNNATLGVLTVASPLVSLSAASFELAVQQGYVGQLALAVSNTATTAANAYAFNVEVMPRRRVGLFSDGTRLGPLVAPLRRMGFDVEHYTNNFAIVHVINPTNGIETVVQQVRYTWDDELIFRYDFVVADLTGAQGNGRVLSEYERAAFENYLNRGGKVLFTGANPLTQPDNEGLAPLCGVELSERAATAVAVATASANWNGVFATLTLNDKLSATNWIYDLAPPVGAQTLFVAGTASKLTRHLFNPERGGTAYLWSGNVNDSDWAGEGLWQDILRDILRNEFYQPAATQTSVPWLRVSPTSGTLISAGTTLSLSINEQRRVEPGTYEAVVALVGRDKNEEVVAVPVKLILAPATLRAYTTGQVTDWRGRPLRGNGGSDSAMYQVIYAGADGLANPPTLTNGSPTGDDLLLAAFPSGEAFARFGAGVAADSGRFDALFTYTFPVGTPNAKIYVRAWDGPSFESSLVYGDSIVRHTATYAAAESRDFGSWQATNIIDYLRDLNGDSIPDGWVIENRPDLDPRAVHGPLSADYASISIQVVPKNLVSDPAPRPYRVVVSKPSAKFVFALDQANNRIAIIQTNNPAAKVFFGSSGSGTGQFSTPEGMAADPRAGQYRLAVADTSNHRVQLFTYDPVSGVPTFERAFGTRGSGAGNLNRPAAVAFDNTGRLFVADKVNNRIAIFRVSDGAWLGSFTGTGSYVLSQPQGLCVDTDLDGGVWVCDTLNNRVTLYTASGVFKRSFGSIGTGDGQFQSPVDVQIWRVGSNKRLAVADKSNNRVQILAVDGAHLLNVGSGGTLAGQLSLPHGVYPMTDEPVLCVADTQNGRIQWFTVTLDADLDGMDDLWEDEQSCLSSAADDADGDADDDGLTNLAESLIGTDPCNWDSNGNGGSDGWELANGRDPLAPSAPVNPPHVVSFSAAPSPVEVGEATTITVVYDQPIDASSAVELSLSGGASATVSMTRVNSVTYQYVYGVQLGDVGVVDGTVTGAYSASVPSYSQDLVVQPQSALFTVLVSDPSVVTSITAFPTSAVAGQLVTITVTFSKPVVDGTPKVELSGAATLAATAMSKVNATNYVYAYVVPGSAGSGTVAVTVVDAIDAETLDVVVPGINPTAFTLSFPAFAITAITVDPASVSWQAVAGGSYNVETNASLTTPAWGFITNVTAVNEPVETVVFGPLPSPMFFRVKRVNP